MNKIHKNLNIENLMKTEWFNQFNENQQYEILKGLEDNLDVSIYAKKDYSREQMREIREGLESKLDVKHYAHSKFTSEQMA